ncbi:LexA family protein [Bacillus alveayuensis]|jgi:repressor LexA|uniref:LexA family protein n=1 Tax=Aeribacillus alveayuensis TaxID=279215 RepID=UPI0005D11CED|nr:XRE family transcriptional regulator [Bacillus alveayuensis]
MEKAEIIERLIKEAGYSSRRQFAEMIGIPPTTLNSMLNRGLGKASIDNVLKVCKGLGITVEELEEMANQGYEDKGFKNQYILRESSKPYTTSKLELPLYGDIAAGALATVEPVTKDNVEYIKLPKILLGKYANCKNLFALKVNGESMNKIIPNGSYVACKPIEFDELKDDDIVVFSHDNEYSMKRFRRDEENRLLIFSPESTDRKYHDIVIPYDTMNDLKIYAKVIWYAVTLD